MPVSKIILAITGIAAIALAVYGIMRYWKFYRQSNEIEERFNSAEDIVNATNQEINKANAMAQQDTDFMQLATNSPDSFEKYFSDLVESCEKIKGLINDLANIKESITKQRINAIKQADFCTYLSIAAAVVTFLLIIFLLFTRDSADFKLVVPVLTTGVTVLFFKFADVMRKRADDMVNKLSNDHDKYWIEIVNNIAAIKDDYIKSEIMDLLESIGSEKVKNILSKSSNSNDDKLE